jgi:hypothetical protein
LFLLVSFFLRDLGSVDPNLLEILETRKHSFPLENPSILTICPILFGTKVKGLGNPTPLFLG